MHERARSLALKAAATATTMLAVAGAALYVGSHVRSQSAPLHPRIVERTGPVSAGLTPSVSPTSQPPLTGTYVS